MPKCVPANADGLKAWVREASQFGRTSQEIVWAESAADARHMYRKMKYETIRVRRATVADVGQELALEGEA